MSKAALKNGSVSINPTTCSSTSYFSNNVPVLPLPPGNINNNLKHPIDTMEALILIAPMQMLVVLCHIHLQVALTI